MESKDSLLNSVRTRRVDNCPICDSKERVAFESSRVIDKKINGVRCINCGLIYMDAVVIEGDLHMLYDGYNKNRNIQDVELEKKRKKMYLLDAAYTGRFIGKDQKSILDIGCGEGDFLSFFDHKMEKYGIEIDATAGNKAREKYPDVNFFRTLENFSSLVDRDLDIILFRGTIQYMTDIKGVAAFCDKHTRTGSKVIILATPNADSLLAQIQKEHWGLFNRVEHKYCFGMKQINLLFGNNFRQLDYDLPYLGTPYENYLEDLQKVIKLFECAESNSELVKTSFPFFGSMMSVVLEKM